MIVEASDFLFQTVFAFFHSLESSINPATPLGIIILGLVTGIRHAFEGDHIAAVSTLIANSDNRLSKAPILGALWGIGHTISLFAAGIVVLIFAVNIPERLTNTLEFGVGVMLVILALSTITGFNFRKVYSVFFMGKTHSHLHQHKDTNTSHIHTHNHKSNHRHGHKSIIVGMIHGLAGSGALMLVILSTIDSVQLGLVYIAVFGTGSIIGMSSTSTIIGLPISKLKNHARAYTALRYVTAIIAFAIGIGLIYEIGIQQRMLI